MDGASVNETVDSGTIADIVKPKNVKIDVTASLLDVPH